MVVRTAGAGLRRLADVAVMRATDFGNLHDPARLGELDGPDVRRILVEREMRASPVIVGAPFACRRRAAGARRGFRGRAVAATKKGQKAKCWSRRVIIEPGSSPDQSRQINHFPPD